MKILRKSIIIFFLSIVIIVAGIVFVKILKYNSPPNVVELSGGMGNQMFQYAFAKKLEKETGRRVLFNNLLKGGVTKREYALGIFGINVEFIAPEDRKKYFIANEKNAFKYDENLIKKDRVAGYPGYFQNEKYFVDIKGRIKRDFRFPKLPKDDIYNRNLLKMIKKAKNPVFIHLRRGDYIRLGWQLPASYYKDAVKYILEHVEEPTFFVFGVQSSKFIKNELNLGVPFYVVGEKNAIDKQDWKDMYLMSQCKHGIIANSSFSWWAAWLGPYQHGGIVVAPTPFVKGHDENIPEKWVKIKREVVKK